MSNPPVPLYLPRAGQFHYSDFVTWNGGRGKSTYINRFFKGNDNLNTPAIRFGAYLMEVMEHEPEHELVKDICRHPHIEYDLECMLGGEVPILTHPDSIDIDDTLALYEYKTALEANAWTVKKVYSQVQISFYQMCVRELKGTFNAEENYIVEIPTERQTTTEIDGVVWDNTEKDKYLDIWRKREVDGSYTPVKLHRRKVTALELDKLKDEVITAAREVSELYHDFLMAELNEII